MNFEDILDRAKQASGATSDSDLSRKLGVSRQAVSNWRHGTKYPDTVTCATIAGITGIPLAQVIGIVGEARAISREEKAVWRKLAASVGVALIAVLATLPSVAHAATPALHAASSHAGELMLSAYALCEIITRTVRRTWRYYWTPIKLPSARFCGAL
ncbi:DUF3693 domain-containing protein [Pseudoxanthomonas beigongshangi]|uniref:DUF3693 domain-containing protein n=1 Tax=Pseudoxanthomonas beigongshangi TaxID=2782537 RepID=UPI00193C2069|nr:DUF3693 domain-containing protein [Pseudoxanthomonas beigongshangi]